MTVTHCDGPGCSSTTTSHRTIYKNFGEDEQEPEGWTIITPYDDTVNRKAFCCWVCARDWCDAKHREELDADAKRLMAP